jgi:hypothetical protein
MARTAYSNYLWLVLEESSDRLSTQAPELDEILDRIMLFQADFVSVTNYAMRLRRHVIHNLKYVSRTRQII